MSDEKLKRNNGTVTEVAHLRGDKEKFEKGFDRIFGNRERVTCPNKDCGLSSRQKMGDPFDCPHCDEKIIWVVDPENEERGNYVTLGK